MTVAKVYDSVITNAVDVIGDIVSDVRAEYDPTNLKAPYYEHGHPLEIVNTLMEKTDNDTLKFEKFPLIALFEDIDSKSKEGVFQYRSKINLIIAVDTDPNYKAGDRYTASFDAILTPIYKLFIKHYLRSRKVHTIHKTVDHEPIYHVYWGKKGLYGVEGNVFNDHIDAIEIKNLDLKIYR